VDTVGTCGSNARSTIILIISSNTPSRSTSRLLGVKRLADLKGVPNALKGTREALKIGEVQVGRGSGGQSSSQNSQGGAGNAPVNVTGAMQGLSLNNGSQQSNTDLTAEQQAERDARHQRQRRDVRHKRQKRKSGSGRKKDGPGAP